MSEFKIEDLDVLIARGGEGSLAQLLALQLKGQIRKCEQMAAENVALKAAISAVNRTAEECELNGDELKYVVEPSEFEALTDLLDETPATDRIYAGIKADGRVEGINFAASRLAAAFNHGFVDKPMAEVGDVVRMILDAKADLANSPIPPEDGLSGEYAEKSLAEWEAALREGADK